MIDRIVLSHEIELDTSKFDKMKFKVRHYPIKTENGVLEGTIYISNSNGVSIKYNPANFKLYVTGRFVNYSSINNKVITLGEVAEGNLYAENIYKEYFPEVYCYDYDIDDNLIAVDENFNPIPKETVTITEQEIWEENLDTIIYDINQRIYSLTGIRLDILNFKVIKLDVCFNIPTEYFNEYILLFNEIFKNEGLEKKYTNFALKNNKPLYSSFYIKPKANYRDNSNSNYTINFYNKLDQLLKTDEEGKFRKGVTGMDLKAAEDILRLEVKMGYQFLNTFSSKNSINKKERPLKDFIDITQCADIIRMMYKRFIDKTEQLDFHSYKSAKTKIVQAGLKNEKDVLGYIEKVQKGHKINDKRTHTKYRKILADLGIHFCFIPKQWQIEFLPSPMKLLDNYVSVSQSKKDIFEKVVLNGEHISYSDYDDTAIKYMIEKYNIQEFIIK